MSKRRQDKARQFGKELGSSSGIALWRDGRHTVVELLYLLSRLRILEGVTRIKGRRGDSNRGLGLKGNLGGDKPMILLAPKCECHQREDWTRSCHADGIRTKSISCSLPALDVHVDSGSGSKEAGASMSQSCMKSRRK